MSNNSVNAPSNNRRKIGIITGVAIVIIATVTLLSAGIAKSSLNPSSNTLGSSEPIPRITASYDGKEYAGVLWSYDWQGKESMIEASFPKESIEVTKNTMIQFKTDSTKSPEFSARVLNEENQETVTILEEQGNGSFIVDVNSGEYFLIATAEQSDTESVTYMFKINIIDA
ncbi:MAG TPA: hypothetical protein VF172_01420 [Nitrososphaera sp.]